MRWMTPGSAIRPIWVQFSSIRTSLSPGNPQAARGATIPSRDDQMEIVGTGGLPDRVTSSGGASTL